MLHTMETDSHSVQDDTEIRKYLQNAVCFEPDSVPLMIFGV